MIEAWPAADVRAAEEPLLAAGVPLMERAAFALAAVVRRDLARRRAVPGPDGGLVEGSVRGARVALLVGAGNNGGDALHAGAFLARRGLAVTAYLADERVHDGGLAALRGAGGRVVVVDAGAGAAPSAVATEVAGGAGGAGGASAAGAGGTAGAGADVVLDGLVGIGARGPLRGTGAAVVAALLEALPEPGDPARPWVVAVDVPSGVGVDDGTVPGPVLPADRTVTFGAAKPGLLLPPATHLTGAGAVIDLGLELAGTGAQAAASARRPAVVRLEDTDVARAWPVPGPADHKYTRGVVGVVAGTATYPGAAVLASSAAVRAGAGMVRYQGPDAVGQAVVAARPEVVTAGGRVQAWVLGPGFPAEGDDDGQRDRARAALAAASGLLPGAGAPVPAVVDAGALALLDHRCPGWVVLTPHAGELAALLRSRGDDVDRAAVEAHPLRWARRAHELTGATVLLKGGATVVVGPGPTAYAQADAPGWLATAGAGDVLAGLLGTMLAARSAEVVAHPERAAEIAAAAALVHGRAAERANPGGPVAALDVAGALPGTVAALLALR
ncbi:bifunctional ADP-dependent (S)-NAD(P)H-hydrate dehydratase/NAD(P)H-hydrate epimerase [Xylanimonas oleitrophica]|uniref:Bifunctional NAD(P)H-hydrate repair enzyme n=1 Tax=Xylanimonas oleitrophica TaxID=2607479 RepID=A0A2W5WTW1_9MICO|nr:bifunctional ADP-dependent NAD(P)H-hydrate dehydratase/NAD(P)H-hydrate epimerase [Xylanimonas oleitrophica]PZR54899.1 bifunctional ADP-dependent (S)-NAD(P)H-hydrate dehydratase/NAD(P)H-hydrate epimerase [Xylanimonas oleitrophica]